MPLRVIKTVRDVKNSDVGIDISVPSYEPAASPKLVKNYHVVVITSLPHFKEAIHEENSNVQFMVQRDYEDFEKLQNEMSQCFPHLKLPSLPRKYHLFTSEADIEERQIAFDCLLKVFCKDKRMCTSSVFLSFLGFCSDADIIYLKKRAQYCREQKEIQYNDHCSKSHMLFDSKENPQRGPPVPSSDTVLTPGGRAFAQEDLFKTEEYDVPTQGEYSALLDVKDSVTDILPPEERVTLSKDMPSATKDSDVNTTQLVDIETTCMERRDILTYIETNTTEDENLDIF